MLPALNNWRRQRDSRWQEPRDPIAMQLAEWPRGVEPEQRQHESFMDNNADDSGGNNDVTEHYARRLPSSFQGDNSDVGTVSSIL